MAKTLRRWPRIRFSARQLLLAVLLLCVGFTWFSVKWRQAEVQRRAVNRICANRGAVLYEHEDDEGQANRLMPDFLLEWLGQDFCYDVMDVYIGNPYGSKDEDLAQLELFPHLRTIDVTGDYTDAGLAYFRKHKDLKCLSFSPNGEFTGTGLLHLAELKNLKELHIDSKPLSPTGMERLARLTTLEELYVAVPDDDYAECLAELTELRTLNLQNSPISGKALRHLGKLSKLEYVVLYNTKVTGPEMAALASLPKLRTLDLRRSPVTDEDLQRLSDSPNLQTLDLWMTEVTDEGVKHLARIKSLKRVALPSEVSTAARQQLTDAVPGIKVR